MAERKLSHQPTDGCSIESPNIHEPELLKNMQIASWCWQIEDGTLDLDGEWAHMLGIEQTQTPHTLATWRERVHPEDYDFYLSHLNTYLQNPTGLYENIHRLRHADKSWRCILTRGRVVKFSKDGVPTVMRGISIDLSRNESHHIYSKEELSRKQNQAKLIVLGKMASSIAHEINNPLSIIRMNAEYLCNLVTKQISAEKIIEKANKIISTADRMSGIIRALRSISASGKTPHFKWVSFQQIIDDVLDLCQHRIRNDSIELLINTKDLSLPRVFVDAAQMTQTMINLLNNSCDAIVSLDTRWIKIDVYNDETHLFICVTDSGSGIPDNIMEKMTDQFFTTKEDAGLGLGLNLVQSYITCHGGKLDYTLVDGHTRFTVKLPLKTIYPQDTTTTIIN
ncbi:MAG: HAMP domain-containing histidine kinase [Bdellovibrionaceae bacterium]|nr:HAMP domain-containing histidine kinase [Pseudobdellovibrionaceae bacterium]